MSSLSANSTKRSHGRHSYSSSPERERSVSPHTRRRSSHNRTHQHSHTHRSRSRSPGQGRKTGTHHMRRFRSRSPRESRHRHRSRSRSPRESRHRHRSKSRSPTDRHDKASTSAQRSQSHSFSHELQKRSGMSASGGQRFKSQAHSPKSSADQSNQVMSTPQSTMCLSEQSDCGKGQHSKMVHERMQFDTGSESTLSQPPEVDCTGPSQNYDAKKLTPEEKLERALAAAQAVGPKLPSYMAPGAINPKKFQSLQEKRKLLWSKKKEGQSRNKWETVNFGDDEGGNATQSKFRRLMGIGAGSSSEATDESQNVHQKHSDTKKALEEQYELSRFMTHMAKGVGLGYGSASQMTERKVDSSTDNV